MTRRTCVSIFDGQYDTGVGQLIGMAAGFAAVLLTGAATAPVTSETHEIALVRVGAVVLTVLIVPGVAAKGWASLGVIASTIGLVTLLGEAARRVLLAVER